MAPRTLGKATTFSEDLSTSPGLNDPIVPVDAGADVLRDNPAKWQVTLTPDWSPTPIKIPLPLRLWNCRCLILNGLADADVLNAELKPRKVQPFGPGSKAFVQLYGSDYIATTAGPFKAVFTLILVNGQQVKGQPQVPYLMWWKYYGTSLINKEFKEKVWGIVPNHLAVIETAYYGKRKGVRLLEAGRTALKMVWNSARFPHVVEVPQHLLFKTVAPGRADNGENDVELGAIVLKRGDSDGVEFPFDSRDDEFEVDPTSELGRDLKRIDFTPVSWQCMLNYGGVVKIYDEYGSGTPPKDPTSGRSLTRPPRKRRRR